MIAQPDSVSGQFGAGEILMHKGRLSDGESRLRRALECDPDHCTLTIVWLLCWESPAAAGNLSRTCWPWCAAVHFSAEHLIMAGDVERVLDERHLLTVCRQTVPDDPLPMLGEARIALATNDVPKARSCWNASQALLPGEMEAQARLGSTLVQIGLDDQFFQLACEFAATCR